MEPQQVGERNNGHANPGIREDAEQAHDQEAKRNNETKQYKLDSKNRIQILTVNTGGGREALDWALEQDVQILMIQEHVLEEGPLANAQVKATNKGWQGVWQPALNTGKHGRSGGVATLVRQPVLMILGGGDYNHRWHSVMVQWTRKTKLHIVNIYGKEGKQLEVEELNHKLQDNIQQELQGLGRVPWVIGGFGTRNQDKSQVSGK